MLYCYTTKQIFSVDLIKKKHNISYNIL